jgi:hypothetical protein
VDGKPIECREMLKNDTVSKDASSFMAILHGRGAIPRVGLNPTKRSTQGHPRKTSKNPEIDSATETTYKLVLQSRRRGDTEQTSPARSKTQRRKSPALELGLGSGQE